MSAPQSIDATAPAISITQLYMRAVSPTTRTILDGVDLIVHPGETVGIVGESGSGKSMTAKAVMRLLPGTVEVDGEIRWAGNDLGDFSEREMTTVRGGRISLLMQDPFTMLNPLQRCGVHIAEGLKLGPMASATRAELHDETLRRLAEVGIRDPDVAARYPFQLSGGMRQRVALAAALARDPDILIADEPSTALDVTTQAEILELLADTQRRRGMSLVLITHDLRVAFSVCDRIYVMYAGRVLESGLSQEISSRPRHPYTQGLLLSDPPLDRRAAALGGMTGSVPTPDSVADLCAFAPRCPWARDECRAARPELVGDIESASACLRINEIANDLRLELNSERAAAETGPAQADPPEPLLVVTDLRKTFEGSRGRRVIALDRVDLTVCAGEAVGLVGESGSGKSTLGRCIVGLDVPTSGEIRLGDVDIHGGSNLSNAQRGAARRAAQMVFQDPYSSLDPRQSIGGMLRETLGVAHADGDHAIRSRELLELVGLPSGYISKLPRALSGGERQRVAIARSLAIGPRLLVCDEPVSALDVSVQAQVLQLLRELRAELGISYLFITHDLAVVRQIVDRVYVLYRGSIVESGPVDQVLDAPQHEYTRRLISAVPRNPLDSNISTGDG